MNGGTLPTSPGESFREKRDRGDGLGFDWRDVLSRLRAWKPAGSKEAPPTSDRKRATIVDAIRRVARYRVYATRDRTTAQWFAALADLEEAISGFSCAMRRRDVGTIMPADVRQRHQVMLTVSENLSLLVLAERGDAPARIVVSGRPSRKYLADIEARLSLAGFGPAEIARLIPDGKVSSNVEAQKRHRGRIKTRARGRKPRIRKAGEAADRIMRWKAGTGDPNRQLADAEFRALCAHLAVADSRMERKRHCRISSRLPGFRAAWYRLIIMNHSVLFTRSPTETRWTRIRWPPCALSSQNAELGASWNPFACR